jgi:hypothetical protein
MSVAPAPPVPVPPAKAPTTPERSLPGAALASRPRPQVRVNIYDLKNRYEAKKFFFLVIYVYIF